MTHRIPAVLGVDFGTTNTVVALADQGGVRVVQVDGGESLMPSCVVLSDDGLLLAGRTAQRMAATAPDRFVAHPKLHVDEDAVPMGGREVPVWAVIGAVFHRVVEAVVAQLGGLPQRVVLTHPAGWSGPRLEVLRQAARHGGLGEVELLPEPVAAAVHHAHYGRDRLAPGSTVAVYDLGGGTFDVAVLAAQPAGSSQLAASGRSLRLGHLDLHVLADRGDDGIGGAHFDDLVLSELAARHRDDAPDVWAGIAAPVTANDRRFRRQLLEDVRATKEGLSETMSLALPLPGQDGDALLTRTDLEDLICSDIDRTVEVVRQALADARVTPADLAAVYTVGGSSRIPLVSNTLLEAFGIAPTAVGHPEQTVALGAAVTPPLVPERTDEPERRRTPQPSFWRRNRAALVVVGAVSAALAVVVAAVAALALVPSTARTPTPSSSSRVLHEVAGVSSYRTGSSTVVSWDPYAGAVSYALSRDGSRLTTTAATTYTDVAPPAEAYHYEVLALAADGDQLSSATWIPVDADPSPTSSCPLSRVECDLIAALPSDMVDKASCEQDTLEPDQQAAVVCAPVGAAAAKVYAQRYTTVEGLRAALQGRQPGYVSAGAPPCSSATTEGIGTWNESGADQGDEACFLYDGSAWMEWGYDSARIRMQASADDPSSVQGIVSWWAAHDATLE